ncbi:MAG: T9SS type A sorting domain-containing protein [Ginsengibacter sp.]
MRIIFSTFLLIFSLYSSGQSVMADPAVSQIAVTDIANLNLNPSSILLDNVIKLKIPVYNLDLINGLPAGSCKIKIGLGSKLILDPQFDLSLLPSGNYFNWTAESAGGQVQITGELKTDLPSNFSTIAEFYVKGNAQGNSTVTTNFLVTNHNTDKILSDEVPNNNTSSLAYTIAAGGPTPVTFAGLNAVNKGCSVQIDLYTENEVNVRKYEIEISRDGVNFVKTGEMEANNFRHYQNSFNITEANKASVIFVRVKSLDKDGRFMYSGTKSVKGLCDKEWGVSVFPNPANEVKNIMVNTRQGIFNGRYLITLSDVTGKLLRTKEMNLIDKIQFSFDTGNLSAGQYVIKIVNLNNTESAVVKWQKY